MTFQHLKYGERGRVFVDDRNPRKKRMIMSAGQRNTWDAVGQRYVPYIWYPNQRRLVLDDLEYRFLALSIEVWWKGTKIYDLSHHPEANNLGAWERKAETITKLNIKEVPTTGATDLIELDYTVITADMESVIKLTAGGRPRVTFGYDSLHKIAGEHRLRLETTAEFVPLESRDKKTNDLLPSTHYQLKGEVDRIQWLYRKHEIDDHIVDSKANLKIDIQTGAYDEGETRSITPLVNNCVITDDGYEYHDAQPDWGDHYNNAVWVGVSSGDEEYAGFGFTSAAEIAGSDTITEAYFRAYCVQQADANTNMVVKVEDDSSPSAWSASHFPFTVDGAGGWCVDRAGANKSLSIDTPYFGEGDSEALDLVSDFQILQTTGSGIANGQLINVCLWSDDTEGTAETAFEAVEASNNDAELRIEYTVASTPQRKNTQSILITSILPLGFLAGCIRNPMLSHRQKFNPLNWFRSPE